MLPVIFCTVTLNLSRQAFDKYLNRVSFQFILGLKVTTSPSASVTEGQRVTLTCTTSCPLNNNTVFLWYMDGRPLTLQNHNKHLLLDPVSSENAGNYSCVVMSPKGHVSSAGESLTVKGDFGFT